MYLDKILGSKTKVNALSVLVAHPQRSLIEKELAKEAGASVSEVNRQVKDLVNVGLIIMERVGKTKVYRVNQQHFLYEPLKSVFRDLEEIYHEIANKVAESVAKKSEVKTVVLFGSLAMNRIRSAFVKEPSDVDIMVIVKNKSQTQAVEKDLLEFINSKIFPAYGINVYPIVLSVEEYLSGLAKDPFIMNVHSSGEVLYGDLSKRESLEEFRRRVRELREMEWGREAVRARQFTGEETFQQGVDLIKFAMRIHEAAEHAGNR